VTHHFLALDGAATLATEHLLLTRRAVRDAIERCAMAVIHGEAGLGKTFAVEDVVAGTKEPVLWTSFPSRPTPRLVAADLLERLSGRSGRRDRFAIVAELVDRLTQGPRLLVVDESQLLTGDCIELLRYLHDHRRTHFALVLVGGHGSRTDPMFPGTSHGRTTTPAIRRTLTGLDAPASLWEPPTSLYDNLDGRTLLHGLNRHHLFPPPEPQAQ